MGIEPAKELLRKDRILSFEEFRRAQEVFGVVKKKSGLLFRLKRLCLFPITLSYRATVIIGAMLLTSSVMVYAYLSTCVVNEGYKLVDTKKSLKNLNLVLAQQELANTEQENRLKFDEEKARELGLIPLTKKNFIVRTNIKKSIGRANTVEDLYPLSDKLITIKP